MTDGIFVDTSGTSGQKDQDLEWGRVSRSGIRYVSTSAGRVRVRDVGSGPVALVLAADGPNMIEHYDRIVDACPDHIRVVCIDPPGNGFSAPAEGFRFTFDQFAESLVEVLDEIDARNCILAFGCVQVYMALLMAAKRPDIVKKLVLMQAARWPEEIDWLCRWIDPHERLRQPGDGQMTYAKTRYKATEWWYGVCLGNKGDREYFVPRAHEAFDHGACHCLASLTQAMLDEPPPTFERPEQETVVIWGLADETHKASPYDSVLDYVPGARLLKWDDAGHSPEIQQPARFIELVAALASDMGPGG